jgi:HD-GYP domain-containing protein (c-di-GMP phosphodiesterase class II)
MSTMWESNDVQERLGEYESLLEIGVELASSLDLNQVLGLALDRAEKLCRAETSSIWEVDETSKELFFRVVRGEAASAIRGLRVPMGQGIVGSIALSGVGEVINDVRSDPRWRGDLADSFKTRAILTVPLFAHGRVVGVLQLLNPVGKQKFDHEDLERMRLFAGPLGQAIDNARLYTALKSQYLSTVTALAEAVEKRDPYTGGHVRRVVQYSILLGFELGLPAEELDRLRLASALHDVGKIAVPDQVLRKPAPLDPEEAVLMKRHTIDGAEIVARIPELHDILPGVRSHHERLDGLGYPDGLFDAQIPLPARIIAVADTYDAMTTSRPYRSALEKSRAVAEIVGGAGSHFCPVVVSAFEKLVRRDEFNIERGARLMASLFGAEERL